MSQAETSIDDEPTLLTAVVETGDQSRTYILHSNLC